MEKFVVANWKASLTRVQAEKWLQEISSLYQPVSGLHIILAVPFPFLMNLQDQFKPWSGVSWASQDVSSYPLGNYTGSVPAAYLADIADYAIVGHRERRRYFRETIQDVANKVTESLEEEITPIVCVDLDIAGQQAASLELDDFEQIIVAYTPADAEQLEMKRRSSTVADGIAKIASLFPGAPVLYGGGVNEKNVAELFSVDELAGVMVAGGCLDPQAFVRLLRNAGEALG